MKIIQKSQFLFVFTFVVLILVGTILLSLPGNHKTSISLLDCLFTATSAVCVTGLNSVDITTFTFKGQLTLILLMQLGGLGIMTLSTSLLLLVKQQLNLENRLIMANINETLSFKEIEGVLRTAIRYTLCIESIGFLLLIPGFWVQSNGNLKVTLFNSLFHAVSAFCNAGFSTYSDNLINCNGWIKFIISLLIIFGGLGFYVVFDIFHSRRNNNRIRIHSKIVLTTTLFLIFFGMIIIMVIEWPQVGWLDAYFQSVTTRTAGFNSVDLNTLHPASLLTMIILMFIGASPMSTGGGIKTTTFFIIVFYIYSLCKGNKKTVLLKRHIPNNNIMKAFAMGFCYFLCLKLATLLILLLGPYTVLESLFEVTSALGTVGLSLGLSMKANVLTKLVLILCMFLGRIGPLSFLMFLILREKESMLAYPEERIILG